ncbi:MAG TPA: alpha/beta family hydrolase [Candidatus Methylomirabilis sp.]|nr:alpha/beta family hydrolase [Candidatus Methylomirabilis sp.]
MNAPAVEPLHDASAEPAVRGLLHRPAVAGGAGLVLCHGAGSDCNAPLLVSLAEALASRGLAVLRCDLPYRQSRRRGPPRPGGAALDREGLRRAAAVLRGIGPARVFLGGQSYGGRQASMLAAEDPGVAASLLLLSYPLHPPGNAGRPRTAHFPELRTPALFAHGSADPFGTLEELEAARALIPARTALMAIDGAGHGLAASARGARPAAAVVDGIADRFLAFVSDVDG